MSVRVAAIVLFITGSVYAQSATRPPRQRPTTAPATALPARAATRPVAVRPQTQPVGPIEIGRADRTGAAPQRLASPPATQPAGAPSVRDLVARWQTQRQRAGEQISVAHIDLNEPLIEKPADFSILGDTRPTVQDTLRRLREARQDDQVQHVLITLGSTDLSLAQAQEVRDALADLRKAGKRSFVYADSFDTATYIAASASKDICMLSGGEIMIPGVGMEAMFYKGLMDKVGVKADYIQIGQYKGADEQYTRSEPSAEMRGEMKKLVDALYEQIVDGISYHRNLPRSDAEHLIGNVMIPARQAKQKGLVDHLVDQDGLRDLMKKELGKEVALLHHYGTPEREPVDFSNPFALFTALAKKPPEPSGPAIAIIYVDGVIIDGEGGESMFGGSIAGSDDLRKAFRIASRDPEVKAIVLRIDSPGGSASASEVIWQAARRAAREKPLIVSIGGMAASGGYYIACAGEHIFADPSAIVGSIGVVGGKFVMQGLFEKLGVHTESFLRGENAGLFSSSQPFSDKQRRIITNWMQQTYDQFVDRVMTTRRNRIKDIDEVAHGRVFLAKQARQLGMVDELGGIEQALAHAAEEADLKGEYRIKIIPQPKTLADMLMGNNDAEARMPTPQMSLEGRLMLQVLPADTRRLLVQQLQVLQLFQRRPVALVAPFVISIK